MNYGRLTPSVGRFIPQCDNSGSFNPQQCHPGTPYCWCVDKYGNEIPRTRSRQGLRKKHYNDDSRKCGQSGLKIQLTFASFQQKLLKFMGH